MVPVDESADLLLTYFTDTWSDGVDRGLCFTLDRMIIEASKDPRICQLMVGNPFRSAPISAARRLGGRPPALPARTPPARLVQPLRIRRRDPVDVEGLLRAYARYEGHLRRAAVAQGMQQPVVITASPFVAAFCRLEWAGPVTYLAYDDWSALPALRPWWSAIEAAYERIADRRRQVAAVSEAIIERIAPTAASAVIPNGIEPAEWQEPWSLPAWADELARPSVVYVGVLDERLDVALLEATAARLSGGEVVLVGPVGDPGVVADLARIRNVRVEGPVGRAEVAGLIAAADVCIMPHRSTQLTRAMSPLKLYEYLAGGAPAVVTDLPPVRQVDPRVIRTPVGDAEAFAEAVERAMEMPATGEPARREFLEQNSWSARYGELLQLALGTRGQRRSGMHSAAEGDEHPTVLRSPRPGA